MEGHEDLTKSARAEFFDKFVVFSDGGVHHFGNFVFLSIFIRRKQIYLLEKERENIRDLLDKNNAI